MIQGRGWSVILVAVMGAGSLQAQTPAGPARPRTTQASLEAFVIQHADTSVGGGGVVQLLFQEIAMVVVTDTAADRMRIVAPVVEDSALTDKVRRRMLEANFHTALDAHYAMSDGIVYAVFIHPLSPLTEEELLSGLQQVASLVRTFGTSFSSGILIYGQPQPPEH